MTERAKRGWTSAVFALSGLALLAACGGHESGHGAGSTSGGVPATTGSPATAIGTPDVPADPCALIPRAQVAHDLGVASVTTDKVTGSNSGVYPHVTCGWFPNRHRDSEVVLGYERLPDIAGAKTAFTSFGRQSKGVTALSFGDESHQGHWFEGSPFAEVRLGAVIIKVSSDDKSAALGPLSRLLEDIFDARP